MTRVAKSGNAGPGKKHFFGPGGRALTSASDRREVGLLPVGGRRRCPGNAGERQRREEAPRRFFRRPVHRTARVSKEVDDGSRCNLVPPAISRNAAHPLCPDKKKY